MHERTHTKVAKPRSPQTRALSFAHDPIKKSKKELRFETKMLETSYKTPASQFPLYCQIAVNPQATSPQGASSAFFAPERRLLAESGVLALPHPMEPLSVSLSLSLSVSPALPLLVNFACRNEHSRLDDDNNNNNGNASCGIVEHLLFCFLCVDACLGRLVMPESARVCVCIHIYMCIYIYVCMYARMHVCMYACMHVCMDA